MGQELEATADQELQTAEATAEAERLAEEFKAELSTQEFTVPMLVLVQATSRKPPEGSDPGDFVNTLTGENHGTEIEFIPSGFYKGRFLSNRDTNESWAASSAIVPENWPEEYVGQHFADLPDAEEVYSARTNEDPKNHPWGKGPKIATTYNFVGFVAGSEVPVRLSLMRASTPTARKIIQLLRVGRAPWDNVVNIASFRTESGKGDPYQGVKASRGRETTAEERLTAVALAQQLKNQRARYTGDDALAEDREKAAETPDGALDL